MNQSHKKGIILMNLGSPDSPTVKDVKRYLSEFLMDGRVIDVLNDIASIRVGLIGEP